MSGLGASHDSQNAHDLRAGLLVLYASIMLLALNGLFAKLIPLDPTMITVLRSAVACVALVCVITIQGSSLKLRSKREFLGIYGLGVLLGVHWITYFYSMQVATVAIGMLALFSYPVLTVLIEPLFQGKRPKLQDVFAALLVLVGVFLMVSEEILAGELNDGVFLGAVWGVFSAFLFSLRNTSQKYLFPSVNSMTLMAHQTLAVAVIILPFMDIAALASISGEVWLKILVLGCLSTAGAHTFLSMSLKRLPAKTVGLISCATPVFGGLFAWLVIGEAPTVMVYVGGGIILGVACWETLNH